MSEWKRLTVKELKKHVLLEFESMHGIELERTTFGELLYLIEVGLVNAFETPDGEIAFKISATGVELVESKYGIGAAG